MSWIRGELYQNIQIRNNSKLTENFTENKKRGENSKANVNLTRKSNKNSMKK